MMRSKTSLFSLIVSAVFALLIFWTFARTFYLAPFFGSPVLPVMLRLHGVVMSGWVVLLVVQSALIPLHRVRWHRWLGMLGVGWAGLVVVVGSTTTLRASMREVRGHTDFAPLQLTVTGLELTQMLFFTILVVGALWWRRRGDVHGRLMLLTIITMLPTVLSRLPVDLLPDNAWILWTLDALLLLLIGIDTLRHRRLHPAFGWGGLSLAAGLHLAMLGAYTSVWRSFLSGLVA